MGHEGSRRDEVETTGDPWRNISRLKEAALGEVLGRTTLLSLISEASSD